MGLDPLNLLLFNRKCLKRRTPQLGECSGIIQSPTYHNPFPANEHVSVVHNRHSSQRDLVTTNIHLDYCAPLKYLWKIRTPVQLHRVVLLEDGKPRALNGRHGLTNVMLLLYIEREVKPLKSTAFIFFFIMGLWMHMYFHGNCPHSCKVHELDLWNFCEMFSWFSPKECWSAVHLCMNIQDFLTEMSTSRWRVTSPPAPTCTPSAF